MVVKGEGRAEKRTSERERLVVSCQNVLHEAAAPYYV